ncbi:hypothetical protein N9J72_00210 [Candidatus Gracilibacteria bacterium]|nr:hypothetical protein [Candidatus Gracilibacteria bacterium]
MKRFLKPVLIVSISVFLIFGIYTFGYVQASLKYIPPHFHANFAMYINGVRVDFSGDKYMEDVAGCSLSGKELPKDRVHLHENNGDTIHIHDDGVSWGHFFSNNNFAFGEDFLVTDTGEKFLSTQDASLSFLLNGELIENPFNKLINSEDRLLINYGEQDDALLLELFENVSTNAGEYNAKYDPGSCGGTNENGLMVIIRDRVTTLFGQHEH